MKFPATTLFVAVFVLALASFARLRSQESGVRWHDDLAEAALDAKTTNRPMLVVFR